MMKHLQRALTRVALAAALLLLVFVDAGPERAPSIRAAAAQAPIPEGELELDGDRTLLRVRNRTPFMVILEVSGVRVGWMRPYRTGLIRGLQPGYHKLYAYSRFGSMSWGPREIWVPGSWNLLY